MNKNKNETKIVIKPAFSRHISIDENIHQALSIHSFSLYMVLRFNADFRKDDSEIIRSAQFLYTKAKIKKSQYYISMKELEANGLVMRDPENKLGEKCAIHVARELGYFTQPVSDGDRGVHDMDRGVHDMDRGVHDMDTDQYSSSSSINTTISNQDILNAYHEYLPELTRIKVVDRDLGNKINSMKKNWSKYQKDGKAFSLELFIDFLKFIRNHHSWFLKPRTTESGNVRKNSLRNLIADINLARFANGEFSAN